MTSQPTAQSQAVQAQSKSGPCLGLYALQSRLTKEEFEPILALCEGASAKAAAAAPTAAPGKKPSELIAKALERLAFEPTWQMSLLLGAVPAELHEDSTPGLPAFAKKLGTAPCEAAKAAFVQDAKARRAGGLVLSPLRNATVKGECARGIELDGHIFVVIPGHASDQVTLAFQAPGKTWETRRLASYIDIEEFRYWFTLVPINSRVVMGSATRPWCCSTAV